MKKCLVLFGAAILVMALASPSMAQFKSWGHIEIQTIWERRPDFNTGMPWSIDPNLRNPGRAETWKNVAERYRFYLQYGDPKTVRAVLGFEADSQDWGELQGAGTGGNVPGGSAYYAGSNHFGVYRGDSVQLEVKHAYVDFTVPNTPVSITAGLQFFDVAGRIWMNNDAPGIIVTANFAPHRLRAFWWRENDNNRFTYEVNDTYGVTWDMTKQLFNIGAWGAYKNDRYTGQIGTTTFPSVVLTGAQANALGVPGYNYPNASSGTAGQTTGAAATFGATSTISLNAVQLTPPVNPYNDMPWWVGVSGGFRPGNFDFSGQFIYNGGKRSFTGPNPSAPTATANTLLTGGQDSIYSAWEAEAYLKYRIGPGLFAGVEGFYSSGQNADRNNTITLFQVPTSTEGTSIFGNDRTVIFWMNAAQMGYYHQRNSAFQGFWYGRANVEYSPLTWLRMNFNYLYIGDNYSGSPFQSGANNGVSPFTRVAYTAATKIVNGPVGARQDKDLNYVGSEINVITTIRIYQNFDYNIGLAMFLPSTMYDRVAATAIPNQFQVIQGAQTSYAVNTKLIYAF